MPDSYACSTPIWVHCLSSIHVFAIAYWFIWYCYVFCYLFNLLWRGWVIGSSFFTSGFFFGLGIALTWAFSYLLQSLSPLTSSLWVNWYSYHTTTLFLPWYLLTWIHWASFGPAMYYSFPQFTLPSISTRSVLISSWASLAHSIPLGILGLFHSFRHPRLVSFLGVRTYVIHVRNICQHFM